MKQWADVLRVLNGLDQPDIRLDDIYFSVCTGADEGRTIYPFELGEIFLSDKEGREILGEGRRYWKWSCHVATFETLPEAINARNEALS